MDLTHNPGFYSLPDAVLGAGHAELVQKFRLGGWTCSGGKRGCG